MKRGRLLALVAALMFAAFLLWTTLATQQVECTVTVLFGQRQNTATASAASEQDALREAKTAACGPLARGMNESIACGNAPATNQQCRGL
jgi:hypothetical protein